MNGRAIFPEGSDRLSVSVVKDEQLADNLFSYIR